MRRAALALTLCALLGVVAAAGTARAATGPLYDVKATWGDTHLPPGKEAQFLVQVRNIGDAVGSENLVITEELPAGVTAQKITWDYFKDYSGFCKGLKTSTITCTAPAPSLPELAPPPGSEVFLVSAGPSGYLPMLFIDVKVGAKATGTATNTVTVSGGGAAQPATDVDQVTFDPLPSPFGLVPGSFTADNFTAAYPFGEPARQASDRPFEFRIDFDVTAEFGENKQKDDTSHYITSNGQLRTFELTLPRGMIGNPEATPKCDPVKFAEQGSTGSSSACPPNTQVGYLRASFANGTRDNARGGLLKNTNEVLNRVAIYNLEPPKGVPVDLGFIAGNFVQGHAYTIPDPSQEYALKTLVPNISSGVTVRGAEPTIWGVPGDSAHDRFRFYSKEQSNGDVIGAPWGSEPIRPFLTNPIDCGFENGGAVVRIDSYSHPGQFSEPQAYPDPLNVSGCGDPRFRFEPDVSLQPTDRHAGAPTGLDVHLKVPQRNEEVEGAAELYAKNGFVKAIATPPVKKTVVTFPEGMTLSPSAAQGLQGCTAAEISLNTDDPVTCPDASQYGTLTLHTPIFPKDAQPEGWIYIAKQGENPFHNFLSFYMVIQEPERGILIKVPFKAELNPVTGQITGTFDDLPQFPVSDLQMTLKGGVRAGLVEPSTCGKKTITAEFFSWQDPGTPHTVKSSYEVTEKPDGSPCVNDLGQRPFRPGLQAGTTSNSAGSYSPFALRLTRTDDDQEFSQLALKMAEGLTGKLAGISRCPDASIAQAQARTAAGDGALEQRQPSCPASSLIGTTQVGAGVGVPLTYVPGKVYLAGPYHGSPLSAVAITPALVGPYDLGVVAVRSAIAVDPETTQVTVRTDPFPQIFQGIPVRIRDIRVNLDREGFILNPSGCAARQIDAHLTGTGGDVNSTADDSAADLAERFQAADCASLGFKPQLSFRLRGGTSRGSHPKLTAIVKGRPGDTNIAGASVALPHSEFLDQAHIKTVCTRVQFAAKQCPAGSVYGHVTATSPLFEEVFSGPVYLRSSSHPLPDLVAAVSGPPSLPVEVDLVGRIDSVNGGIRSDFDLVPDVPVTKFVLTMQGAKKGLFVNSTNLCATTHRARAKFTGQNGKRITLRPEMRADCEKRKKHKKP
jgi:hypothetical protein